MLNDLNTNHRYLSMQLTCKPDVERLEKAMSELGSKQRSLGNDLEFNMKLLSIRDDAMRLGLYITARAIGNAIKAVGWEQSGDTTKAASYVPDFEGK